MTEHTPSAPRSREEKSLLRSVGSVLDFLFSLLRKMPVAVVMLVIAILIYYQQPGEEQPPRFREPPDSEPASLPAGLSSPETDPLLPLVRCVKVVDADLSKGRWGNVYLGMEVRPPDGKVLTIAVTEKWQGLSSEERREMVQQVVDTWVKNGQALGLLKSAQELEAVHFKQVPSEQPVATWQPASGPQILTPG